MGITFSYIEPQKTKTKKLRIKEEAILVAIWFFSDKHSLEIDQKY
jgi:hypothetical protein